MTKIVNQYEFAAAAIRKNGLDYIRNLNRLHCICHHHKPECDCTIASCYTPPSRRDRIAFLVIIWTCVIGAIVALGFALAAPDGPLDANGNYVRIERCTRC